MIHTEQSVTHDEGVFVFERERDMDLLVVCVLTEDRTRNLGIWGQHSNQMSYPDKAGYGGFDPRSHQLAI